MFDPDWIGEYYFMPVCGHPEGYDYPITVDHEFNITYARGMYYWFNCTDPHACPCLEDGPGDPCDDVIPTEGSSWSSVKALF